ncbi:MAG: hypothetical protein HKN96_02425 [Flavobacteriaceae bacterium]|nr:hypothetical protein [Flavobacteriaceae bacterium]
MKVILTILVLFVTSSIYCQTYEFLNQFLAENDDNIIYLDNNFQSLNTNRKVVKYLNNKYFTDNWRPLPSNKIPSINEFLDQVDLSHLGAIARADSPKDKIDFKQLSPNIVDKENLDLSSQNSFNYLVISKPYFSCSKNWVIIYGYSVYSVDTANSGYFYIYRKMNNKWVYYHKLELWMS